MTDSTYSSPASWPFATRVAFRFCCVYFVLYVITTQMLPGMVLAPGLPDLGDSPPVRGLVVLIGKYLLRLADVPIHSSGSGDMLFNWVHAFSLLFIATIATVLWSIRSGNTTNHARLYKWFRLFIRFAVAATMLSYGFAKVIPLQMPTLALSRLVEPFGDFSPMGVLWYSVGAAPAYEVFIGTAEVFAGLLLILPRTTMFGAMVCLMDAIGIFALNMTYDVPVKLFSFHLILFSLVLLAPNLQRLFDLFIRQRAITPVPEPLVSTIPSRQRRVVIGQFVFGALIMAINLFASIKANYLYGAAAPRSPLFGIWAVEESVLDGVVQPPLLTDTKRWKHVVLQSPERADFQLMNDQFIRSTVAVDTVARTFTVITPNKRGVNVAGVGDTTSVNSAMRYERPLPDQLVLDGELHGKKVHMTLKLRPLESFLQKSRGFNWVQEYPFNR